MAATVQIHEMTAEGAGVDKTSSTIRFKSAVETTVDTNNRVQIPGAGTDYSYTKQARVYVSVAPSIDISNLQAYSDGSNGLGTGVGVEYDTNTSFITQTDNTIGGTDIFTKTSGSAINMDQYNTGPFTGTGYQGDYLRMQLTVASTASPGATPTETITFSYDES